MQTDTTPETQDWVSVYTEENLIPFNVSLELTYRCNAHCIHCYAGPDNKRKGKELSTAEWIKLLDELAAAGCLGLTYTGGEIMLRDDFWELAEAAVARNFALQVFSNGMLVDKDAAQRFKELNVLAVGVSLYSVKAQIHDKITGVDGSFEKSLNAIKLMRQAGLNVLLKHMIMRPNKDEYPAVFNLCEQIGAFPQIDPVLAPANDGSLAPIECRLNDEDLNKVLADTRLYPQNDGLQKGDVPDLCSAGRSICNVNPYGDITPCIQLLVSAGNIRRQSFSDIWKNSPQLQMIRAITQQDMTQCRKCEIQYICGRCPGLALLEDGNLLGPSKAACQQAKIFDKLYTKRQCTGLAYEEKI